MDRGGLVACGQYRGCRSPHAGTVPLRGAQGRRVPQPQPRPEPVPRAAKPGPSNYLYTSDFAQQKTTIVRWTGAGSSAFTDQYSTYMTWGDQATLRPHRCMWTNELR